MDYVRKCFYQTTQWNEDNSYANVVETFKNEIDFEIPQGVNLTVSAQSSQNSCTSYSLSNLEFVSGSLSYLFTTTPLLNIQSTKNVSLQDVVTSYKVLEPLREPADAKYWEVWQGGMRVDVRDTLLYGRVFLPGSCLEAMFIRRLSPTLQLLATCVSDSSLKNNGALTVTCQRDNGHWSLEGIYSTHEALVGLRTLYNFGFNKNIPSQAFGAAVPLPSRLSAGFEIYYGILNKAGGASIATRYTTQSTYTGTPLTLCVLANPLMGHLTVNYAVKTTYSTFASRFDFNIYSYLSDLSLGCELWRTNQEEMLSSTEFSSVIKASTSLGSQTAKVLWEGRFKELLVSSGIGLSTAGPSPSLTTFGIQVQYAS